MRIRLRSTRLSLFPFQSTLERDSSVGDVLAGGCSGVTCASIDVVSGTPVAVLGCADGRLAMFCTDGVFYGAVHTSEVIRCV